MRAAFFLLTGAYVLVSGTTFAQSQPVTDKAQLCGDLGTCWSTLFSSVRANLDGTLAPLEILLGVGPYERAVTAQADRASTEGAFSAALLRADLDECRDLVEISRSREPVDLLVVGRSYDANGALFDQAADGYYSKKLKERCGSDAGNPQKFDRCRKGIVVLHEPGKERLLRLLSLLPAHTLKSFTYVGHGENDQIVLGERTLTRPPDPHTSGDRRKQWAKDENGSLYVDDLDTGAPLSKALRNAFAPGATVSLYACKTGQYFAGVFAAAAGVPAVLASSSPMHFAVVDDKGKVVSDPGVGPKAIIRAPRKGEHLELVPDEGRFEPKAAHSYDPKDLGLKPANGPRAVAWADEWSIEGDKGLVHQIAERVAMGSGDSATVHLPDGTTRDIVFSKGERSRLAALLRAYGNNTSGMIASMTSPSDVILKQKFSAVLGETQQQLMDEALVHAPLPKAPNPILDQNP